MPIHSSLLDKPRLLTKLKAFYDHLKKNDGKIGTFKRGIEMNYNNACNLRCKYCFTNSTKGEGVKHFLPIESSLPSLLFLSLRHPNCFIISNLSL